MTQSSAADARSASRDEAAADVLARIGELIGWLEKVPDRVRQDPSLVDMISGLEGLIAAVTAAQLRTIAALDASQRASLDTCVPPSRVAVGVAAQVGLACGISPQAAAARVATARGLVTAMPRTLAAMTTGSISGWVGSIVERETRCLPVPQRRAVDAKLAALLSRMSPRQAEHVTRWEVAAADPTAADRRAEQARAARRVLVRMCPDAMARLIADIPAEQALQVRDALDVEARRIRRGGDQRTADQIRADLLVGRVVGRDPALGPAAVEIGLVMTPAALFGDCERAHATTDPADSSNTSRLAGYGPIPAALARRLAGLTGAEGADVEGADVEGADVEGADGDGHGSAPTRVWIRRLFTDPVDSTVVTIDDRRRVFPPQVARLVTARDQFCRMPSCRAPIRHIDHVVGYADGGATSLENAQGLCEHHNYVKQAPGWAGQTVDGRSRTTTITTPTGHIYTSSSPPALGP